MLAINVCGGAVCRLEGHGAKRTLVEDFAVLLVNVDFQHSLGHENHPAVAAPGEKERRHLA